MPVETMDSVWPTALWKQFGAAIDMLDNALVACPIPSGASPSGMTHPFRRGASSSGISAITRWSGSTCIFLASRRKTSRLLLPLPGENLIPPRRRLHRPIAGRMCAPISQRCARSAAQPSRP